MKSFVLTLLAFGLLAGCASRKDNRELEERENKSIKRDYLVTDASSSLRPGWIEDASLWSRNHNKDMKKYSFFSFETEPKVGRSISCNLAKASARADIASEIATFIDKQLGTSQEGSASIDENNPNVKALRDFVENTLAEKIQALIHGARVSKTYWEKRKYKQELGAVKNFTAYTCAAFIRMPNKRLMRAINEAANHVVKQVDDPETKANVKNALKNAKEDFVKMKSGKL